jgi:formylglycine-generating enzyme
MILRSVFLFRFLVAAIAVIAAALGHAAPNLFTDLSLTTPGLVGTYINHSLQTVSVPDDWRTTQVVAGTRTDTTLAFMTASWGSRANVGITGGSYANWDKFSVQWDGYIQITRQGDRLATASDDGSRMWIDIDRDGLFEEDERLNNGWGRVQGVTTGERSRRLSIGTYAIRIQYYEVSGGTEFHLVSPTSVPPQFVPTATNPVKVVKALVLNFEPRIPSEGNRKLWEVFNWNDPRRLAAQFEADTEYATGGAVDVQIVESRHFDEFPRFEDGFRYNPDQYVQNRRTNTGWQSGNLDFYWLAERENLNALVNSNQVDELWCFGDHYFNLLGESWMAGPNAFFVNGPTLPNIGFDRAVVGYGFNYERGVAEMIHNLGHRTENHGQRAFGAWNLANPVSAFDRFSANFRDSPGKVAGVGSCHLPANGDTDYDYANTRVVQSTALDWVNYPATTGSTTAISRGSWSMGPAPDYQRDYLNFYFGNIPRNSGTAPDGRQANWFKYIWDFNSYEPTSGLPRDEDAFAAGATIRTGGAASHEFTVRYYDRTGVDGTSLDNTDIQVTGPNSFAQTATLLDIGTEVVTTAGTARAVRYRITAPGGSWDLGDSGTYRVLVRSNQVRDTLGNLFPAIDIGQFQVQIPNPSLLNVAQLLASGGASVTHTTIDIGPISNLFDGSVNTLIRTPNIDPAVVTLTFTQPQTLRGFRAYFSYASGNPAILWQVETADTQADLDSRTGTWRQAVASTGTPIETYSTVTLGAPVTARLARFTATKLQGDDYVHINEWQLLGPLVSDSTPPGVTFASPNVSVAGGSAQFITATVSDASGVDVSSLHTGDLLATGPNGFSASAVFYGVDSYFNGSPRLATYWLIPPGGFWDSTDSGTYTLTLQAGGVSDVFGNAAPAQTLGTFTVNVPPPERRPSHDLAENNASSWQSGADGGATATTSADSTHKILGASSIRFTTNGGFDTWLRYSPPNGVDWDLTEANNLYFSIDATNSNPPYFQSNSPWVRLRDSNGGYFEYHLYQNGSLAEPLNSAPNQWRAFTLPLRAADTVTNGWRRTVSGAPRLDHISTVEFHADTTGNGFELCLDRVGFDLPIKVSPTGLHDGPPQSFALRFDQSVSASLTPEDFVLVNTSTGATIPSVNLALAYDPATHLATLTFPGQPHGKIADGQYQLTLAAGSVADPAGNTLPADFVTNFAVTGDADNDGLPTTWENTHLLNPADAADASRDSDGDGKANLAEYFAGTDPRDSISYLAVTDIVPSDDELLLTWRSAPGRAYQIHTSDDLAQWTPLTNGGSPILIPANGVLTSHAVSLGGTTPKKFYRVEALFLQSPSLSAQPAPATVVSGSTTTLSVTPSGTGPFTYHWFQGAVGVTMTPVGTNSASFTTPALSETTSYWVRITNTKGSVDSVLATVTVATAPGIMTQPASTTITSGSTATLSVTASGTAPLTYQWYQGAVGTTTSPLGTNSASFTTAALTTTTTYWVRVSNTAGNVNSALATVTVGSSTPTDLALIPAGAFTMGRTSGDTDTNAPPVTVTVSAFYLGKNEVTKALWDEVRTWGTANGYTDLAAGAGKAANHPVQTVSWWDVIKWCNARSEKEGLTPCYTVSGAVMKTGATAPTVNWSANGYRLPTEAEWEKAARGGVSGKRFPWGTDTISHSQANFWNAGGEAYQTGTTGSHPSYATGSTPYTSSVGAFAANAYGLHDMAGNVWEWCWDWYGASTYVTGATDPRGAVSGTDRVSRGGSWYGYAFNCRAASRVNGTPWIRDNNFGFRIARSSVP